MKILVIGDFHGKFPKQIPRIVKKEKIDLVVSLGDYFPFSYRKLWFKHCYGKGIELWEVIGKKKYKKLVMKDLRKGEYVLKKVNSLSVPVISVYGNLDYTGRGPDNMDIEQKKWKWGNQNFFDRIIEKYKNIYVFSYSYFKFGGFVFIGTYGSTNRGNPKDKTYKINKRKMEKIFNKFKKENKEKKVVFVGHNVPYNTKLDKVSMKANKKVRGKSIGSRMIRSLILKYQPLLYIGGHIHESAGKDKLKKSILVNPGAVQEGKATIIDFNRKKKNIRSIRFVE